MKDGRVFNGPIWEFKPKEGYFTIPSDETAPDRIYFRDVESAVTPTERRVVAFGRDACELERARELGWDGT